ncbi:hypothetical protein [Bdellovibrio sp. NC01]|uniref:hypothetical protein n=1 Tax=Bdellovibrio sp. NC01 TaxID=2220073 RepID=UPI00115876DF|nr:hypothetical protein [Bdellovibrio sp. NC01]
MEFKRHFTLIIASLALSACATDASKQTTISYQDQISWGNCELAEEKMLQEKEETKYLSFYQNTIGQLGYVCSLPITLTLDAAFIIGCPKGAIGCVDPKKPFMQNMFPYSYQSYEVLKDVRCPDTDYYVQKSLAVAQCYEKRTDEASLKKSLALLDSILINYNSYVPTCIRDRDAIVVKDAHDRVMSKIAAGDTKK